MCIKSKIKYKVLVIVHVIHCHPTQDQDARAVLTESNRGQTLFTIFGLITCSIPLALKGALLTCLASFSKSANVSADMWLLMEKAQVSTYGFMGCISCV